MLERLKPFIWRKYLDFAAHPGHPVDQAPRSVPSRDNDRLDVPGHDLERGQGGIRNIELYAQTQQLIWGGRDSTLRSRAPPVTPCAPWPAAGRTNGEAVDELIESYRFLRRVEQRLQLIAGEPTCRIPDDADGQAALSPSDVLCQRGRVCRCARRASAHRRKALFRAFRGRARDWATRAANLVFTGTEDDPDTLASLQRMGFVDAPSVSATVRRWHHGRIQATRSTRARELLTELMPDLLRAPDQYRLIPTRPFGNSTSSSPGCRPVSSPSCCSTTIRSCSRGWPKSWAAHRASPST